MQPTQSLKFIKLTFLLISISFFVKSSLSVNNPILFIENKYTLQTERGLEIRYIIITDKIAKEKNEITIDGVKYPLFKTKESAIEAIKYASPKKDYTIVYVLTEKKKNTEIIAIPADNN